MNITLVSSFVLTLFLAGCTHTQKTVENSQLEQDQKKLMLLTQAYQAGKVTPMDYIKESRVLRDSIDEQRESSGHHGHMH